MASLKWPKPFKTSDGPYELVLFIVRKKRPITTKVKLPGVGDGEIQTIRKRADGLWQCRTVFTVTNVQLALAEVDDTILSVEVH